MEYYDYSRIPLPKRFQKNKMYQKQQELNNILLM